VTEALAVKTGATYVVTDLVLGAARHETYVISGSSFHGRVYSRRFLSICDISFRTPVSDIRAGMCGTMTHGDEAWRVRVTDVSPMRGSLEVRGLAMVSHRTEWLDSAPSSEPLEQIPEIEAQFYDL
jgi:hypothetical protein